MEMKCDFMPLPWSGAFFMINKVIRKTKDWLRGGSMGVYRGTYQLDLESRKTRNVALEIRSILE